MSAGKNDARYTENIGSEQRPRPLFACEQFKHNIRPGNAYTMPDFLEPVVE